MEFLLLIVTADDYKRNKKVVTDWLKQQLAPEFEVLNVEEVYSHELGFDFAARVKEVARDESQKTKLVTRNDVAERIRGALWGIAFFRALTVICMIGEDEE